MDDGNIKFHCEWRRVAPVKFAGFEELNEWRNKLYQLGLIGVYPNNVGYGNISLRNGHSDHFYITGSGTGSLRELNEAHFSQVIAWDFVTNSFTCRGPVKASSESLTHAAVYLADPEIKAVIHAHHFKLWEALKDKIPTTNPVAAYGTVEMAREISRLFSETDLKNGQVLIMAGHQAGIVSFGKDLKEAAQILVERLKVI